MSDLLGYEEQLIASPPNLATRQNNHHSQDDGGSDPSKIGLERVKPTSESRSESAPHPENGVDDNCERNPTTRPSMQKVELVVPATENSEERVVFRSCEEEKRELCGCDESWRVSTELSVC